MYNPLLDTFIAVVDNGSFTKASQYLYISSTAVMKQINSLENHLGLQLIERKSTGIVLTSAGEVIYRHAKLIKQQSDIAINEARETKLKYDTTFCIGTSVLNPAKPFMDLWYTINKDFPNYKLHLVPFNDTSKDIVKEIALIGEKYDFLIGVCDSKKWLSLVNFTQLGTYKKMIAVSRNHPLANKKVINIEDMYGYNLIMVAPGDSQINDNIRNDLSINHPQINIINTTNHYDMNVFNHCAESNDILLTISCWQDVHPGLINIDVNWDYTIPYGLLYSYNAPQDVLHFVDLALQQVNNKNIDSK